MKYCFDVDGVICDSKDGDYSNASPKPDVIAIINRLASEGHYVIFFTARGSETGIDWADVTKRQLQEWGVTYQELRFGKPAADIYVDDRGVNVRDWALWNKR